MRKTNTLLCLENIKPFLSIAPKQTKAGPRSSETPGQVFSYKLRYIVGFGLVEMAISTNQKPTIYLNLYENTDPALVDFKIKNVYVTGINLCD